VSNANLTTLLEAPGVLDAAAFAIVLCGAEALLIGMEGPGEQEYGGTDKHGTDNQCVPDESSHSDLQKTLDYISTLPPIRWETQ
jgi:hypothetical protein